MSRLLVVCCAGIWSLAAPLLSRGAEPRFNPEVLRKIPERMQQFVDAGQISGAVTLIATADRIEHLAAVGLADRERQIALQTDSLFRVASMTKPITATALMMLVEQGKLELDTPVARYLPAFQGQHLADGKPARPVTIRDVLTHTAGLASGPREGTESMSLGEQVDAIGRLPLRFPPGSQWQYSSGLTIAGRLIEVASGEEYAAYLQRHLFQPLGMSDTTFRLTEAQRPRLAVTYRPGAAPGSLAVAPMPDPSAERAPNPSGGLMSSAADLARFYQAILGGGQREGVRLLSAQSVAEMLRPQTPGLTTGFTPGNAWGLGWCLVQHPQGVTRFLHSGSYGHGGAWGTQGWVDPRRGVIMVLLIQRTGFGNSDASEIRAAFQELASQADRGAAQATARFVSSHGYAAAVELQRGEYRAVLCPEAGGRVLEFSRGPRNAMWFDEKERDRQPGEPASSAGRFDFGPELITPPHPSIWSGTWTATITGEASARLISPRDEKTGVQLLRDFRLTEESTLPASEASRASGAVRLVCTQTIMNIADETREYCHWGRSFSPGGGICVIPLQGISRFPSKYALYEEGSLINVRARDPQIRERDGCLEILAPPRKPKLGFDSYAGWLAYVSPGDQLFVKRFATYPDRVYSEAAGLTISVWYPPGERIELEPIGPRERLAPGETASFTEEWFLGSFPFPAAGQELDLIRLQETVGRDYR